MWWTIHCPFHCLASSLQACPGDNNQRKLVWEKSSKFRLPINITAYLLEKLFMIYVSPLPLLTSPVLHWFAFLHVIWKYLFSVFIDFKSLCALIRRPYVPYPIHNANQDTLTLHYIMPLLQIFKIWKGILIATFNCFQKMLSWSENNKQ